MSRKLKPLIAVKHPERDFCWSVWDTHSERYLPNLINVGEQVARAAAGQERPDGDEWQAQAITAGWQPPGDSVPVTPEKDFEPAESPPEATDGNDTEPALGVAHTARERQQQATHFLGMSDLQQPD